MTDPKLIDYVRKQLAAKVSGEEITKALIMQSWSQQDINEAFRSVSKQFILRRKFSLRASSYGFAGFLLGFLLAALGAGVIETERGLVELLIFIILLISFVAVSVFFALKLDRRDARTAIVPTPTDTFSHKESYVIGIIFMIFLVWDIILIFMVSLPFFILPETLADSFADILTKYSTSYFGLISSIIINIFIAWFAVWYIVKRNYLESSMSATKIALYGYTTYFIVNLISSWQEFTASIIQTPVRTIAVITITVVPVFIAIRYFINKAQQKIEFH